MNATENKLRIRLFYHSLLSDWNHGNAHFLRGVVSELLARGHDVQVLEPRDNWSLKNLREEQGEAAVEGFRNAYPQLKGVSTFYDEATLELDEVLESTDLVIVHEWNSHELVKRIGEHRRDSGQYKLLFHDTHHRAVTERSQMAKYDLRFHDGVLAFGNVIRDLYLQEKWTRRAWTWHEAADVRVFKPQPDVAKQGDFVWVGNWGDNERTKELHEFLLNPVRELKLDARVFGVRYPKEAKQALAEAGIEYCGWLANYRAPELFSQFRVTAHVPRRPYVEALPGIPTIRVFEALACGIPLVSAPWHDAESLFTPGEDFWVARDGEEMKQHLRTLVCDGDQAQALAQRGLETILARHTCGHRVDELMEIYEQMG